MSNMTLLENINDIIDNIVIGNEKLAYSILKTCANNNNNNISVDLKKYISCENKPLYNDPDDPDLDHMIRRVKFFKDKIQKIQDKS